MARTVTSSWTRAAIHQAAALGIDREALMAAGQLTEGQLSVSEGRIPYAQHLAVWTCIDERAGERPIGIEMAKLESGAETMDLIGYLLRACKTAGDTLALLERYGRLLNENSRQGARTEGETLIVEDGPRVGPPWPRAYAEHTLATYVFFLRRWTGCSIKPTATTFQHPAPKDTSHHEGVFGSQVRFGAAELTLRFPVSLASTPIRHAEPGLQVHLEARAQELMARLDTAPIADRVRAYLRSHLQERPTLESCASTLAVGSRTLQRRLTDEGLRFATLHDVVRKAEAERLVRDRTRSFDECAAQCGFAQPSAFRRAFRRWFGQSPSAYRKAARPED